MTRAQKGIPALQGGEDVNVLHVVPEPVTRDSAAEAIGTGKAVGYSPFIGASPVRAVIVGVSSRGIILRVPSALAPIVTVKPVELVWWTD